MTPPADRLAEIAARVDKAAPGPWRTGLRHSHSNGTPIISGHGEYLCWPCIAADENTPFIAHAREDIPWLLAELARVTADRDRLRDALEKITKMKLTAFEIVEATQVARAALAGEP